MIVFGLGNPGSRYEGTRHNAGFMFISALSGKLEIRVQKKRLCPYRIGRKGDLTLVEPLTFMNESGCVFPSLVRGEENILVAVDNMDLPVGQARLRKGGSSAGHNGIKSIISNIGPEFLRLYIGIGRPHDGVSVVEHVLSDFDEDEKDKLDALLDFLSDEIISLHDGKRYELVVQSINSFKC